MGVPAAFPVRPWVSAANARNLLSMQSRKIKNIASELCCKHAIAYIDNDREIFYIFDVVVFSWAFCLLSRVERVTLHSDIRMALKGSGLSLNSV